MRTTSVVIVLLMILPGCNMLGTSDGDDDFRLFTDRDAYVLDDTMQVWFQNEDRAPATLSLCESRLERNVASVWVPIPDDGACQLILLAPSTGLIVGREVIIGSYLDRNEFESGTYRFSGIVTVDEAERRLVSNAFKLAR